MAELAAVAAGGAKLYQAFQAKKFKIAEAKFTREARNRSMAATTREVAEQQRTNEHMQSRALAVAAASGGGVDDPTVSNIIGDINAEGEYRVMSILYTGLDEAAGFEHRAKISTREGRDAITAGVVNAVSSSMSAYVSAGGSFGGSAAQQGAGSGALAPVPT